MATVALERARELRSWPTDAERELWMRLRGEQLDGRKFRRRHPIPPYTVDFFCASARLVIELDGSRHSGEVDKARTRFLEKAGLKVLRFWDNEVQTQTDAVVEAIWMPSCNRPSPQPLSRWERDLTKVAAHDDEHA